MFHKAVSNPCAVTVVAPGFIEIHPVGEPNVDILINVDQIVSAFEGSNDDGDVGFIINLTFGAQNISYLAACTKEELVAAITRSRYHD